MRTGYRGFSLAEFLIAFVVVLLSVLTVVGFFTVVLRASHKSSDTATGTLVAHKVLGEEMHAIMSDSVQRTSFFDPGAPDLTGVEVVDGTEYFWTLTSQTVTDLTTGVELGSTGNRLKRVTVTVTWSQGSRDGYGRLSTELTQVFCESDA